LKQRANLGPYVYISDRIRKISGEIYILTDPDLKFNLQLPNDFIDNLVEISNYFQTGRVGFALFADSDDIRTDPTAKGVTIREWEKQFWRDRLDYPPHPEMELYRADVDTTFCLVNLRLPNHPIRVGGAYTCFHIPWHKNFHKQLMEGEYESYLRNNVTPTSFRLPDEK
jgi:hypothetical protein